MEKNNKKTIIICIGVFALILGVLLLVNGFKQYAFLLFALTLVYFIFGFNYIYNQSSPVRSYNSKVSFILKTYSAILVKNKEIPNLDGRNVIALDNFEDLVDAQSELRKPICFYKEETACSFFILDNDELWLYVEKFDSSVSSLIEKELANRKSSTLKTKEIEKKEEIETPIESVEKNSFDSNNVKDDKIFGTLKGQEQITKEDNKVDDLDDDELVSTEEVKTENDSDDKNNELI